MRFDFIDTIKNVYGIVIDPNKKFSEEVQRVLSFDLEYMRNDLDFLKNDYNTMFGSSSKKEFNFNDALVGIGNVLQGNSLVKENITLSTFIALEKSAKKMIEKNKK